MRKTLFVVLAGLIFAILISSCGTHSTTSANASRASAGEEITSLEEDQVTDESIESPLSAPVASIPEPSENTSSSPALGGSGMVSSAHPLATRAGLNILAEGGNAFDAAVAVAATLGVVEPYMSGIGGYGAILIYDVEEGEPRFLAPGNRTPATLDPATLRPPTASYAENRCGAKAISTPGNVNAWESLSRNYGELEWRRLFGPAVELAEGGYVLDQIGAAWIDAAWPAFPEHAKNIYGTNGVPLRVGERLVQEDLARSLELIAEEGAGVVYGGELGRAIDSTVQDAGGFLTIDDLRNNRAQWRETVSIDYRGYEVVTASPPATSWGALLRLGIMSRFNLGASEHNTTRYLHTFAEASKQAGRTSRDYAADPEIATTPFDLLLSEEFWAQEAANIDLSWASQNAPFGQFGTPTRCTPTSYSDTPTSVPNPPQSHTTHFVVADKEGNVVSATQTLGNIFGSKVMPEGTGIWINDAIAWLRFEPAGNIFDVFPGRQSLYALSPTIVRSAGKPVVALGTPGGRTIIQTTPQMLMNLLNFDMDIQQAIAAPRISTTAPNALLVEAGVPPSVRSELAALGHNVRVDERGLGNAHGLTIEYDSEGRPNRFTGGADPRGAGSAAGY